MYWTAGYTTLSDLLERRGLHQVSTLSEWEGTLGGFLTGRCFNRKLTAAEKYTILARPVESAR